MYPFSEAVLFGSNAVGLSLPTSDIDVMLVGLPFSTKEELCHYLSQIETLINSMGWVISCSTIPQAKVPILKLEIDTRIHFFQSKIMMNNQSQIPNHMICGLDLKDLGKGSIVKVDIIISNDINGVSPTT
jgi:DNA polymerase sigma